MVEAAWERVNDRDDPEAARKRLHRTPVEQARWDNHVRYIIPLRPQLEYLRSAGFEGVDVYWKHLENVIYGGRRPGSFSERIAQALHNPQLSAYVAQHGNIPVEKASLTTDDWPYFYQREPGLPASVITISAVLILLCWFFLRETGMSTRSFRWHFFFLGAGFLLLEAQIISKMALLFNLWVVNSFVIAVLLVLIVIFRTY